MRIVIIGGGISASYLANNLKKENINLEIVILSQEPYPPYDRIHLCRLVNGSDTIEGIGLSIDPTVRVELNQKIIKIDSNKKRVYSSNSIFSYDKLILATGSKPKTVFDIDDIANAITFRSAKDCEVIKKYSKIADEIVIVGTGAIGLELLDTLNSMEEIKHITILSRGKYLYHKSLSLDAIDIIEKSYTKSGKVTISYSDEIVDKVIEDGYIKTIITKKLKIENPLVIFGIGISPNINDFRDELECNRGILTNRFMQTSVADIYAVGECAEVKELNFIAGHVKECTIEANIAISHILGLDTQGFKLDTNIDMLKVGKFELIDVKSPSFDKNYEKVLITSQKDNRVDEYYLKDNSLVRFIGINSNIDIGYIEKLIKDKSEVDINYLYQNRLIGDRGRLICSCEHLYYQDIIDIVTESAIGSFAELKEFSQAGRVCGRCKIMVQDVIKEAQKFIDPNTPHKTAQDLKIEKEIAQVKKRVNKFNRLHPQNSLTTDNLNSAIEALNISQKEVNSWISMVTADMQLHPSFEQSVKEALYSLNRVPIVWLELSDCTGNSEAFIKSTNPAIEELIFNYISLDYHELLMSASGQESETILEDIIQNQKGEYILIVEGAIPLGLNGKYLRVGAKGETGVELLKKTAKDAKLVIAVGSCAFDGGVVASYPNPTDAVGVSQALQRDDIINLPGCPTNPINIVGTLLSYIMFEELPKLDKFNRPLWAYEGRIHDNCERRGHYELGEFVKEWGDSGAKMGYCLFEMGCKGPYANANCPTMRFNSGTSWPVQAGHGCMACTEIGFFDKYANERVFEEEQ